MARFESGVASYVTGIALVRNYFPADSRGIAYECCEECFFYREASKTCALNHKPVLFPGKYTGQECMLHRVSDDQSQRIEEAFIKIIMEGEEDGET